MSIIYLKLIFCFILACFPAYIWGYIYYTKQPESKKLSILTFLAGCCSVFPILLYKKSWEFFPQLELFEYTNQLTNIHINIFSIVAIPLSFILAFAFIGVLEEFMKHLAVVTVDSNKFNTINDAIEFSIIASLGFSLIENIMYFYLTWANQGIESFLITFIFRSIFSTFAHILFSGIYGYYYGIAHFSNPIFEKEIIEKRMWFTKLLHKITECKTKKIFHQEKVMEGLLVATILHAVFDIFLELKQTYIVLPYLIIGYVTLDYLFDKKEDHIKYGRIIKRKRG